MQVKPILTLALASQTAARNLTEALASQNSSLSALNGLIMGDKSLVDAMNRVSNVTILAPDNDAIQKFLNSSPLGSIGRFDSGPLASLLNYHVLNGTYYASNITGGNGPLFIPTHLTNTSVTDVTGGQRVEAKAVNQNITFFSGLGLNSSVVTPVRTPRAFVTISPLKHPALRVLTAPTPTGYQLHRRYHPHHQPGAYNT